MRFALEDHTIYQPASYAYKIYLKISTLRIFVVD
jgi:hypothetical protein